MIHQTSISSEACEYEQTRGLVQSNGEPKDLFSLLVRNDLHAEFPVGTAATGVVQCRCPDYSEPSTWLDGTSCSKLYKVHKTPLPGFY